MTRHVLPAFGSAANDSTLRSLRAVITGAATTADGEPRVQPVHWPARRAANGARTAQSIELERLEEAQRSAERAANHAELAMHRFDEGIRKLGTMLAAARDEVVRQAVEHAFALAYELLRHEASTRPETLHAAIERAVEELGPGTRPTIRLAPADAERLRGTPIEGCTIVDDPRLQIGDFVVEDVDACIDARIAPRLVEIRAALGDPCERMRRVEEA